ncbi:hypothetical protein HDU86_006026 [Geranomyces michiganensis]|nr:hypothetical protein HDU86_006026 [Geranomyces michiganensis]
MPKRTTPPAASTPRTNAIDETDASLLHASASLDRGAKRRKLPVPVQNVQRPNSPPIPRTPPSGHAANPPSSSQAINTKLFASCCALLVARDISRVRLRLMRELWVERGGTFAKALDSSVNTIISALDTPQLCKHLKIVTVPPGVIVALPEWISACINHNSLLDADAVGPRNPPEIHPIILEEAESQCHSDSDATDIVATDDVVSTESVSEGAENDVQIESNSALETSPAPKALKRDESLLNEIIQDMLSGGSKNYADNAEGSDGESNDGTPVTEPSQPSLSQSGSPKQKPPKWQDKFLCMQSNGRKNLDDANKNAELTDLLNILYERHDAEGDHFRALSYRRAIAALKRHPKTVESGAEARKINGIGAKIADKIDEIIATGRLRKAEEIPESEPVLQLFRGIHGCGAKTAQKWYSLGYRTLQDLQDKANLTHNQALGIKYYDDIQQKMPRAEAAAIGEYVIKSLADLDPKFQCMIMGSFRRGRPMCGDVDMIVTHPDGRSHIGILPKLLAALRRIEGLLVADLHVNSFSSGYEETNTYMGICRLPGGSGIHRRLDIWTVPWLEMGSALLHFTGNDIFNRSLRALAAKKHMRLSQHGLFANVTRGKQRTNIMEGVRIASRTEEEIFEALGVPYRAPEERDV